MAKQKIKKRAGSFFSPLISITLVLFLTGMFGLLIIYAQQLKNFLKENLQVNIIFYDEAKEADILRLQKMVENEIYIKRTDYINKEKARQIMQDELGEDSEGILGFNPFPASLDVFFKADFATVDSIEHFKDRLTKFPIVKEVSYQKVLLENIERNVRIGATVIFILMIIFLIIAVILINNTIRLMLYSKRFLIKSMQLVGATQAFIRKPFIIRAGLFGILGAVLANILIACLLYVISTRIPFLVISDITINILLALFLIIFGIIITVTSSYFSVKRYLHLKLDELY